METKIIAQTTEKDAGIALKRLHTLVGCGVFTLCLCVGISVIIWAVK